VSIAVCQSYRINKDFDDDEDNYDDDDDVRSVLFEHPRGSSPAEWAVALSSLEATFVE